MDDFRCLYCGERFRRMPDFWRHLFERHPLRRATTE
jgi:hypothetical protein